jgi:hypothetical protein
VAQPDAEKPAVQQPAFEQRPARPAFPQRPARPAFAQQPAVQQPAPPPRPAQELPYGEQLNSIKLNLQNTLAQMVRSMADCDKDGKVIQQLYQAIVEHVALTVKMATMLQAYVMAFGEIERDVIEMGKRMNGTRMQDTVSAVRALAKESMKNLFASFAVSAQNLMQALPATGQEGDGLARGLKDMIARLQNVMDEAEKYGQR